MKELSEKINITPKGIEWNIKKLKIENRIERVEPTKSGYWRIIKDE